MHPSRHHTARLGMERLETRDNPSGVLDSTFSGDGRAMYDFGTTLNQATGVAIQADGKVVTVGATGATGTDFFVTRSLPNGTLDTTFSGDGKFSYNFGGIDVAKDVAIQTDGKIVVVGHTDAGGDFDFAVIRLNTNGTLDTTFDAGGRLTIDFGYDDKATGVAIRTDGKIVVGGDTTKANLAPVARLTATGALDATFTSGGTVLAPFQGVDVCTDLALQGDGKIVLVGGTSAGSGNVNNLGVVRLNADGTTDTTFGTSGLQTIDFLGNETCNGVLVQPDDKIVVVGFTTSGDNMAVARLTTAGVLDTTFSVDGKVAIDFGGTDTALAVTMYAGKLIVVGGTSTGTNPTNAAVARLTSAGGIDNTFDGDGRVTVDFGSIDQFNAVTVDRKGKVVAAGFASNGLNDDVAVARLHNSASALAGRAANGQWSVATSTGTAFTTATFGSWATGTEWQDVRAGDFNADGLADMAGRNTSGEWWVGINTGTAFTATRWTGWSEAAQWRDVSVGDFNGDGRADLIGRAFDGSWWLARSYGSGFTTQSVTGWNEAVGWKDTQVGDFNGDGRSDVASRTSSGHWWVALCGLSGSTVTATNAYWGSWNEAANWKDVRVGDFNGDGKADIAGRASYDGSWWVAGSSGATFTNSHWGNWNEAGNWRDVRAGDFNGDGMTDIAGRTSTGQWWVATSTGTGFTNALWTTWNEAGNWRDVRVGDFNGDGKADLAGRTDTGDWWVNISSGTVFTFSKWATWTEASNWRDVTAGAFRG